jgi:AbrB family looped-hinge helix DNA binding protein
MNEARVSEGGRVVIPAELREKYGIAIGDTVVWHDDGQTLSLVSRRAAIRRAQQIASRYAQPGISVVDGFLRDKRDEARREDQAATRAVAAAPAPGPGARSRRRA